MATQAYLEAEQTEQLEAATVCLRDRLLVRIPRQLGCRIGEVLGVAVEDINFSKGEILILHEKVRSTLSCPKCGDHLSKKNTWCPGCGQKVDQLVQKATEQHRRRAVPIDRDTLDLIRTYIKPGGATLKDGRRMLFSLSRQRAWQIFVEAADRAGLPQILNTETGRVHNVSPHKLRDAFAVNAVKHDDSGDGIRMVQEMLGHKEITTTMRYRKIAGKELHDWYDKLLNDQGKKDGGGAK
jgi:integrase/recombinase XerD